VETQIISRIGGERVRVSELALRKTKEKRDKEPQQSTLYGAILGGSIPEHTSEFLPGHHTLACLPILKATTVRAGAAHALPAAAAGCVSVAPEAGRCDAATVRVRGNTVQRRAGCLAHVRSSDHLVVAIHPPSCRLESVRARPPGRFRVSDTHLAVASPILAIVVATSFSSRSSTRALIHASLR
jgi:hypothetical protein